MRMLECILIANDCYKKYHDSIITPTGITVHSTDAAGKVLKRFVQPATGQAFGLKDGGFDVTAAEMLQILGTNVYGNSWNRPGVQKAVHAMLGQIADGSYAVCKTLDYKNPCWAGAFGSRGSYDGRIKVDGQTVAGGTLNIQFEMIESPAGDNDKTHCRKLYELAVEFCVYLCVMFPTIKVNNIVSHKEANKRGYASAHGDPESYWSRCGMSYTMDGFRADVAEALEQKLNPSKPDNPFHDVKESDWFYDDVMWAVENGITNGTTETTFSPDHPCTRAQAVAFLRRQQEETIRRVTEMLNEK